MVTSRNSSTPASDGNDSPPASEPVGGHAPASGMPAAKPAPKARARAKSPQGGSTLAQPAEAGRAKAPVTSRPPTGTTQGSAGASQAAAGGDSVRPAAAPEGERMSDEERRRRIAEAAYRKSQERGFSGDRQLDDWLEAEREHDHTPGGWR